MFKLVCSHKTRARTGSGGRDNQHWKRDPFHLSRGDGLTLCGRDCSEWLKMDDRPIREAISDPNCCSRCWKKAERVIL